MKCTKVAKVEMKETPQRNLDSELDLVIDTHVIQGIIDFLLLRSLYIC